MFIGNSLTAEHDIPGLVAVMATRAGLPAPVSFTDLIGGAALEDHWLDGTARRELAAHRYDIVILQQGPSTLPESGINLRDQVAIWAREAASHGARAAVYVVWPPEGGNLDAGIANHEAAATAAGAALYPVGEAWREAWRLDPTMPLYGPDRFHPSVHGSWLAALVMVAMIYHRSARELFDPFAGEITPAQEVILRAAADTAIARFGKR
jgi:hypothetical protein